MTVGEKRENTREKEDERVRVREGVRGRWRVIVITA